MPGCVGFVVVVVDDAVFFESSAAGVASLKAPKPLRHDGVEARPLLSAGAALEEEEEDEGFAADEDDDAAPFPTADGSLS